MYLKIFGNLTKKKSHKNIYFRLSDFPHIYPKRVFAQPYTLLKGNLSIAPPQFAELSRMAKLSNHNELMKYAKDRQNCGLKQWCPWTVIAEGLSNLFL